MNKFIAGVLVGLVFISAQDAVAFGKRAHPKQKLTELEKKMLKADSIKAVKATLDKHAPKRSKQRTDAADDIEDNEPKMDLDSLILLLHKDCEAKKATAETLLNDPRMVRALQAGVVMASSVTQFYAAYEQADVKLMLSAAVTGLESARSLYHFIANTDALHEAELAKAKFKKVRKYLKKQGKQEQDALEGLDGLEGEPTDDLPESRPAAYEC